MQNKYGRIKLNMDRQILEQKMKEPAKIYSKEQIFAILQQSILKKY